MPDAVNVSLFFPNGESENSVRKTGERRRFTGTRTSASSLDQNRSTHRKTALATSKHTLHADHQLVYFLSPQC